MSLTVPALSSRSFARKVVYWFLLAVLILGAIGFVAQKTVRELQERNFWVSHTYEVLDILDDTLSMLRDAQSAARGFAIAGQESFLIPYDNADPQLQRDLDRLGFLIQDNPSQVTRLVVLREQAKDCIAQSKKVIDAYQQRDQNAAFDLVRSGKGARVMGEARNTVVRMQQAERELLATRQLETAQAMQNLFIVGAAGISACLAILSLVFWMIHKEGRRREASERSLQHTLIEMNEITAETRLLGRIGDFLQGCRSMEEAFSVIAEHFPLLLPGTHGHIGIINNSRNLVESAFCWNGHEIVDYAPEECWGLRRGRGHLVEAGNANPSCQHLEGHHGFSLCLPMLAHGETLGALCILGAPEMRISATKMQSAKAITEQISLAIANLRLQEVLRTQSTQDALTGLFNRRYMEATLERETARARRQKQPLSVIMFDVDHFKRFNDTFGHDAGDAVLVEMGRMLRRHSRTEDIACRYGGEEFFLILPGASMDIAAVRAEQIRLACQEISLEHNRQSLGKVTLSLGVACYPEHGGEIDAVVSAADAALYQAKRSGRNQVVLARTTIDATPASDLLLQ